MITYTKALGEEIGRRGEAWYEESLRAEIETPENIGKMILIDVDTGDYAIDDKRGVASQRLRARHPDALIYGIRIGYDATEVIGSGSLERRP